MTDSVSNFCLVCYYDNKTNELVRIEKYDNNDTSIHSDIESYKYGYNAEIVKPEQLIKQLRTKQQECERLKWYLTEIRDDELKHLDIEWDEYETHCIDTEYSNIINLVEEALEERSPEDCRYEYEK